MKKAISAATSAALLASLLATAVAPSAMAATPVVGVGSVARGGTSTNTATLTFTEETAGCISTALAGATATFSVTIAEHTPPAATVGHVIFSGTPVVTAPPILGATASLTAPIANTLLVKITGADPINKQQITITGLKIKATTTATLGAITATLATVSGGAVAACFLGSTGHPTGTVTGSAIPSGSTSVVVTVTSDSTTCPFPTAPAALSTVAFGGTNPETVAFTAATAVNGLVQQTLTIGSTGSLHSIGDSVTSSTSCPAATLPFVLSPTIGTVADVVTQDVGVIGVGSGAIANVAPGEQNQGATATFISEDTAGFIPDNAVLTFTLSATGVLFSTSPTVGVFTNAGVADPTGATTGMTLGSTLCVISFDRTNCTVTVTNPSTAVGGATVNLSNIKLDVASTVTAGTAVNVTVTGAGAVLVNNQTIANVSRVIVGVAAQPTISINFNDQPSGQMSLTEQGAGFFTDGSVINPNNVFGLCITSGETFTRAPWAVVTVGDLKLLSGLVGAASVQGTLFNTGTASCVKWTVYSASTVASTVEIRGSDSANAVLASGPNNGPRYSVPGTAVPGATLVNILVGSDTTVSNNTAIISKVSNAVRAFKSGVTVTALSQPSIPAGTTDSLGGNIQISETLAGQFKANEEICVAVLPRTSNGTKIQDTFMKTATTNDLPVITTNGATGLLVDAVAVRGCNQQVFVDATLTNSFHFLVQQQAFGTLGQITIRNIHLTTTADAPVGSVLVTVSGGNHNAVSTAGVEFQSIVSNAKIGVAAKLNIGAVSALGLRPTTGYSTKSFKVQAVGKFVTWKFTGGTALAGQHVKILAAKKVGGVFGPFRPLTARVADANGIVTFWWRSTTAASISVRAEWTGNATYGDSFSPPRGVNWK